MWLDINNNSILKTDHAFPSDFVGQFFKQGRIFIMKYHSNFDSFKVVFGGNMRLPPKCEIR